MIPPEYVFEDSQEEYERMARLYVAEEDCKERVNRAREALNRWTDFTVERSTPMPDVKVESPKMLKALWYRTIVPEGVYSKDKQEQLTGIHADNLGNVRRAAHMIANPRYDFVKVPSAEAAWLDVKEACKVIALANGWVKRAYASKLIKKQGILTLAEVREEERIRRANVKRRQAKQQALAQTAPLLPRVSRAYAYARWQPAFAIHGLARLATKIHGLQIVRRQLLAPDGTSALTEMTVAALLDLIEYGLAANPGTMEDPLARYAKVKLDAAISWQDILQIRDDQRAAGIIFVVEGKTDPDFFAAA